MGETENEESHQLKGQEVQGGGVKVRRRNSGEARVEEERGKRWVVLILFLSVGASLIFYLLSGREVNFKLGEREPGQQQEKQGGGGIFGPKVYEF